MRKVYLATVLIVTMVVGSSAQTSYSLKSALDFFHSQKMANGEYSNTLTEKDIQGSPYLNDNFIKGSIYTVSKTQYQDIPLRYNIYNDDMEFQTNDNNVLALSTPEIVEKITFGDYTMEYIPYVTSRNVKNGFFELILKGKASLYAKPQVEFLEAKDPAPYKDAEPAKFLRKDDRYYIRLGMEAAVPCGNKKDVLGIFTDHSEELEAFIKKNKINVKKEDELKKLVEYYNSL